MKSSNTANRLVLSNDSLAGERLSLTGTVQRKREPRIEKKLVNAIYSHIRAVRALGRKTISAQEIADALDLTRLEVERSLRLLKKKGVKFRNAA
jgi:hypothetical protein